MPKTSKIQESYGEEIAASYINGISATTLDKKYGISTTTVTSILKRLNIPLKSETDQISAAWDRRRENTEEFQEYIEDLSARLKGRTFSWETKAKMSKSRALGIAEGTIKSNVYGKQSYVNGIFCRSTYEADFIRWCFRHKLAVEPCKYVVPYLFKGQQKHYIPDFYLPESAEIVEVKPLDLKNTELIQAKAKAARDFFHPLGLRYIFITERTLYSRPVFREDYNI